jgi:AcrR family transcriptional regulator
VSRGALQHQFGTRFDVLAAVIDHLSRTVSTQMLTLADVLPGRSHSLGRRIDAAIEAYWAIYTSNTFAAVLNIFLGVANDPEHYKPLQRHMRTFFQMNDEMWLKLVADAKRPKPVLLAARRVFFSALRGLAIGQILGTQSNATRLEFQLIRDMLVAVLTRDGVDG